MTKPRFVLSLGVLLLPGVLFALPRFAVQNGADCTLCHINPSGGGVRNDYGREVFERGRLSLDLPKKKPLDASGGFLGRINDSLTTGGDLRFAYISQSDSEADANDDPELDTLFLMQADMYFAAQLSEHLVLSSDIGIRGALEIYATTQNLFHGLYAKAGAFTPPFGWKLPEHTAINRFDLGFDPGVLDTGVEVGRVGDKAGLNLMFSSGELSRSPGFNNGILFQDKYALSGRLHYTHRTDPMNITLALSGSFDADQGQSRTRLVSQNELVSDSLQPDNAIEPNEIEKFKEIKMGGSIGASMGRLWYLGELDVVANPAKPNLLGESTLNQTGASKIVAPTGYLSYQEVGVSIRQGIDVYAAFEYHDPDARVKADPENPLATDPVFRYGFFVEFFPADNVEIMVFHRFNSAGLAGLQKGSSDAILMLHLFY